MVHEEVGPSEANLFSGKCIIDPNQTPSKQVKPVAQLQKILKFRLATDADIQCSTAEQTKWKFETNFPWWFHTESYAGIWIHSTVKECQLGNSILKDGL